jgi:hypothetical protein
MVTLQHEGTTVKKRLKKSGKSVTEIAAILGMKKKKLKRQFQKQVLSQKFMRILAEKEIVIFSTALIEMAEQMADAMVKNIVYLKAHDKCSTMLLCEVAAKLNHSSYSDEALKLEKNIRQEAETLSEEYLKKK